MPGADAGEPPTADAPHRACRAPGKYDAEVDRIFGAGGPLAPAVGSFTPRQSQTEMAKAIAARHRQPGHPDRRGRHGHGQDLRLPGARRCCGAARPSSRPAPRTCRISCSLRDIPTVRAALRAPVSVALLKGRSNYVCHYHLERTLQNGRLTSRDDVGHLREISRFIKMSQLGRQGRADQGAGNGVGLEPRHVHARELRGPGVPVLPGLLRDEGAPRGAAGRRGRGQPPPVLRRRGAEGRRHGRAAAVRQHHHLRRGAPAAGSGHPVLRHHRVDLARCWNCAATCWPKASRTRAAAPTGPRS